MKRSCVCPLTRERLTNSRPAPLPLLVPSPAAYTVFADLLFPWIQQHHSYKIDQRYPEPYWGDISALSEHLHSGHNIKLIEVQVVRSLAGLPHAPRMTVEHFEVVERQVKEALKQLDPTMAGLFLSLDSTNWSQEMVDTLTREKILFDHNASFYEQPQRQHWPVGRAVFHTKNKDIVAWINHSDHLIIRSLEKRGNIRAAVGRLHSFVSILQRQLKFSRHEKLGYITLKPKNIGSALQVTVTVDLPKLANDIKVLRNLCIKYEIVIVNQKQYSFTLVSAHCMGPTEFQIIAQFFTGIKEILEFEQ